MARCQRRGALRAQSGRANGAPNSQFMPSVIIGGKQSIALDGIQNDSIQRLDPFHGGAAVLAAHC